MHGGGRAREGNAELDVLPTHWLVRLHPGGGDVLFVAARAMLRVDVDEGLEAAQGYVALGGVAELGGGPPSLGGP
ncbi:hypothetical protein CCS92_33410, partial [Methylobacterium radiotolerans]